MPIKRYSFEEVKQYFSDHNCELLEDNYQTSLKKLKYKCSCGNISYITFNCFKDRNQRCSNCANNKKHMYEYVYNYFESRGCKLLEINYINTNTKMKYVCSCGNESTISFHSFKNGQKCRKCSGSEKFTYEYVVNYFQEQGCKCLEDIYINSSIPMKYMCNCGNESLISFNSFKSGSRCRICRNNNNKGENNCNWNSNLTQEDRVALRSLPEHVSWRKQVYERDNYTCQICGQVGGNLQAHHLDGYAKYPELRFVVENGITIHKTEHDLFHHIYGKKKFTKDNFLLFKNNQINIKQKLGKGSDSNV